MSMSVPPISVAFDPSRLTLGRMEAACLAAGGTLAGALGETGLPLEGDAAAAFLGALTPLLDGDDAFVLPHAPAGAVEAAARAVFAYLRAEFAGASAAAATAREAYAEEVAVELGEGAALPLHLALATYEPDVYLRLTHDMTVREAMLAHALLGVGDAYRTMRRKQREGDG